MKYYLLLLLIFTLPLEVAASSDTDEERCRAYVKVGDNYKTAHENEFCMKAAEAGIGSAQYSVGMGYGFAGDENQEEKYYRLAANSRNVDAYIALGHAVRDEDAWEAIYWYQRFVATKADGYGYGALLISIIFSELGDSAQAEYWRDVCNSSPYQGCDSRDRI